MPMYMNVFLCNFEMCEFEGENRQWGVICDALGSTGGKTDMICFIRYQGGVGSDQNLRNFWTYPKMEEILL